MYRISELGRLAGLSRSTLLYYEKQGLIKGQRSSNGYRLYTTADLQRLLLIQSLQSAGLTLRECQACLDQPLDKDMLQRKLHLLSAEIQKKQQAQALLSALLGQSSLADWHQQLDDIAPAAHQKWLRTQGFNEQDIIRLKWLSKDMNTHDQYMADFTRLFSGLERWGPGSQADSLAALACVPQPPQRIAEIGCGTGQTTALLAEQTQALITAIDLDEQAIRALTENMRQAGYGSRVTALCADMQNLPLAAGAVDLIWSEGSAYIMGVEQALKAWRPLLKPGGVLVISDLVWLTDAPAAEIQAFWQQEYADMSSVASRRQQMQNAGYEVLHSFTLSQQAWSEYYEPLQERVNELREEMADSAALRDIQQELDFYYACSGSGEFGYQMFVLQVTA